MARIMGRFTRLEIPHTDWCAGDHRCGVAEHRSADITADGIGGRAWLTRIRAGNREYVEIRARIPLHARDDVARSQLATALHLMRELLTEVAPRFVRLSGHDQRRAITGRSV
ncbi:hypothetical protein [Actinoplanes sp. GCM10030250]|uniref:hypothetical protein n=1 Tax=Actinoplanes sp. GCM10030250 TaxID=3273376 RepID=UPI0036230023